MKMLDMTGRPCPIPVIESKKMLALPDTDVLKVWVDNDIAVQNLEKMATGLGFSFSYTQEQEDRFAVQIGKNGVAFSQEEPAPSCKIMGDTALTVLISSEGMGSGSVDLGRILIKGFIFSLTQLPTPPEVVIFLNGGAKLTAAGSNTIEDLLLLQEKGCRICTCGTCANFYEIKDKIAVGEIVDMFTITTLLAESSQLISL